LEVIEMCCTVITFEDLKMLSAIYCWWVIQKYLYIFSERVKIKKKFEPTCTVLPLSLLLLAAFTLSFTQEYT